MDAVAVAPKYIPLIQKPNCCAVSCLQMILYRNGFGLYDQEDLAVEFGVKIGEEDENAFRENMPMMTGFNNDEGISTLGSVDKINAFFKKKEIALEASAYLFADINSLQELIQSNLAKNNDIWVEYHSAGIYPNDRSSIHDGLVESFDAKKKEIVLIDPRSNRRQRILIHLDALERSISDAFGRELGILTVRKTTA